MPKPARCASDSTLSQRALNRALLARQFLLERTTRTIPELIEHLVGLQAQAPNPPCLGLWTRLERFELTDLTQLLEQKQIIRSAMMRGTLHLVTARDFLQWRAAFQPVLERAQKGAYGKHLAGLDLQEIATTGRDWLHAQPRTSGELGEYLSAKWPDRLVLALTNAVRNLRPLIHVPPAGTWNSNKHPALTTPERWLGQSLAPHTPPDALILRYLAAFGPASIKDVQAWSGFTGVREAITRLRPQLRMFHGERGDELFDVLDAPLPDADTPAPPRFLPDFDNVLLSYTDRTRILAEEDKPRVFTVNGIIRATILVDGFVRGLWRIDRERDSATLQIQPFVRLSKPVRTALEEEGRRLLAVTDAGAEHDVRFESVA